MTTVLQAQSLTKRYGEVIAVNDLSRVSHNPLPLVLLNVEYIYYIPEIFLKINSHDNISQGAV